MGGGAEAARLNLRMQKEIKLLLADPPPFASFPLLSDDSSSSSSSSTSLYSILAHVKGPEDTVYAHGIFKINIQIPERYPFQPPIVTFATPVYHPNIDTGGRICLDILNLPPKGAWQPSLNISTVLTSILLLLSEPNPDDGLMCETSKEYKYNRQAFDQKARSMTEKYARAGATENGSGSGSQNTENHLNPRMMETEGPDGKHNNLSMLKGKLSLESSSSNQKRVNDKLVKEVVIDNLSGNQMEGKAPFQQPAENLNTNQNNGHLPSTNRKLSLESLSRHQKISVQCKENGLSRQCSPVLKPKKDATGSTQSVLVEQDVNEYAQQSHQLHKSGDINSANAADMLPEKICFDQKRVSIEDKAAPQPLSANSSKLSLSPLPMPLNASHCDKQPQKVCVDKSGSGLPCIKHKRLGLAGRKESLGRASLLQSQEKDKENISTVCGVLLSKPGSGGSFHTKVNNSNSNVFPKNRLGIRRKQPLEPLGNSNSTNDANIPLNSYHDNLNETPSKLLCVSEESRPTQKQMQATDDAFLEQIKNPGEVLPMPDSAIVQDSEESDEEKKVIVRPKLSLTRKRLMKKWNAKA